MPNRETIAIPLIAPARLGSSAWLLHLRWFAVAGQLVTILAAGLLTNVELPSGPLLALVGLTAITNVFYGLWLHRSQQPVVPSREMRKPSWPHPGDISASKTMSIATTDHCPLSDESTLHQGVALTLMLLDLLTLTAMLYFSGGANNPFSFFYFVNLAVGGVTIRPTAAWSLTVTAIVGYTFLLHDSMPIEGISMGEPDGFDLRTGGLMLAFATCSTVVTYYVTQTSGELKQRERQLLRAQAEQAASYRLEGLTTLAAGAAHELATPLSTIDVIVRELSRHLEDCQKPESVDTDLRLIDGQLEMCRQILRADAQRCGRFDGPSMGSHHRRRIDRRDFGGHSRSSSGRRDRRNRSGREPNLVGAPGGGGTSGAKSDSQWARCQRR